ncbi:hypothetical protein NL493_29805, partial [Klebsiella pneumoniae]|nr:hypothetical protein [Klebsiella pneumoniae]
ALFRSQEANGVLWDDPGKPQGPLGHIDVMKRLWGLQTEVLHDGGEAEEELHFSQAISQAVPLPDGKGYESFVLLQLPLVIQK